MAFSLPNKKVATTWLFFALIFSAAGLSLWYMLSEQVGELAPSKSYNAKGSNLALIQQVAEQDSDGDGLKDWEETLWKTDSDKADSDGDGTSDGDEVKVGRDPMKAGPADKLDTATISMGSTTSSTELNDTQVFSRQLFAEYLRLQQQDGGEITEASQQYLVDTFLSKVPEAAPIKIYKRIDLKIVQGSSNVELKAYMNAMGRVLKNNPANAENELVILKRALDNNDKSELKKIDRAIAGDAATIKGFLAVPVPDTLVDLHLNILNDFQASDESIKGLRKIFEDPIVTIANLSAYSKRTEMLETSIQAMINTFVKKGIIFTQTDDGYLFMHVI